jgi:hypothetical protein
MTKETYGEYQFVLEEGVYTITELEKLIADLKLSYGIGDK